MYESKLGTTKEQNLQKIEEPKPKAKPKPKAALKPRQKERIIQKKKQYLDHYQYHETKVIRDKNPNRVLLVTHQRLGDIVGRTYEETIYQKQIITDSGIGPRLYSQQSAKTSTRKDARGNVTKTATQRRNTASRILPAQSSQIRRELKKFWTNTNLKSAPKRPAPPQRNAKSPAAPGRGNAGSTTRKTKTITTTRVQKTNTRTQSAERGGRKH